jgi:hypothetical protein
LDELQGGLPLPMTPPTVEFFLVMFKASSETRLASRSHKEALICLIAFPDREGDSTTANTIFASTHLFLGLKAPLLDLDLGLLLTSLSQKIGFPLGCFLTLNALALESVSSSKGGATERTSLEASSCSSKREQKGAFLVGHYLGRESSKPLPSLSHEMRELLDNNSLAQEKWLGECNRAAKNLTQSAGMTNLLVLASGSKDLAHGPNREEALLGLGGYGPKAGILTFVRTKPTSILCSRGQCWVLTVLKYQI